MVGFMHSIRESDLFLSVLTVGELRKGAEIRARRNPGEGRDLHGWIDRMEVEFEERILPVDIVTARLWGELSAVRPRTVVDTLLAATAIVHKLTLVTRNTRDVSDIGVEIVNPWN
jgi:predicted nucleic acid-binding protein